MRVTFDTNTLDKAVRPERFAKDQHQAAYQAVRAALEAGKLRGYFSETLITLEGIERQDRGEVLGSTRIVSDSRATGDLEITISISMRQDRKPLHPEMSKRIQAAVQLGVCALRGPARIGWLRVEDADGRLFEPIPTAELIKHIDKVNGAATAIEVRGVGRAIAVELGLKFNKRDGVLTRQGLDALWFNGLQLAKDIHERRQVERAIAEWADGDSIASHVGYGIDLFCTGDQGRSAGRSILDPDNRAWLTTEYGVEFITMPQLAERLS